MKNYKEMWESLVYELEKHEDETWLNFCKVLENQYDIPEPAGREKCPHCGFDDTTRCAYMDPLYFDYYCKRCGKEFFVDR